MKNITITKEEADVLAYCLLQEISKLSQIEQELLSRELRASHVALKRKDCQRLLDYISFE